MSDDRDAPLKTMWQGKYVTALKRGRWEFVARTGGTRAVVILAEYQGKVILVEQFRHPINGRCLELPAGLVGDEDPAAGIDDTAVKELEEETGFTAGRIERLGEFHSSPGMLSESFTLVRAHDLRKVGQGGGTEHEQIEVLLVDRSGIPDLVQKKRQDGVAIDVKLLLLMNFL